MDLERVNVPQPDKLFLLLGTFTWKEIQATDRKSFEGFFLCFFFFFPSQNTSQSRLRGVHFHKGEDTA